MTDDQRVMYDNAGEVRNTDVTIRWYIATIFLLLHSTGITFIWTRLTTGNMVLVLVFCLMGLLLGWIWLLLNLRMQRWIHYWNSRLEALEREAEPQAIQVFGGAEYEEILTNNLSTFLVLMALNIVIIAGWFVVFILTPSLR